MRVPSALITAGGIAIALVACGPSGASAPPFAGLDAPSASGAGGAGGGTTATGGSGTGSGGSGGDAGPGDPAPGIAHQRADTALQRLLLGYWRGGDDYLASSAPDPQKQLAGYWIFAQAFDAVLDGVERTNGAHYAGMVETFYEAENAQGWTRDFFDDESWMALALMRAFDASKNVKYLDRAESLYVDIMSNGWDVTCCGAKPGGIWWDKAHTQKATASNLGPVIAGVRLSERTGKPLYLDFSKKVYAHWTATMVDGTTHEVADHIAPGGAKTWWKFTYDDGLLVGAGVELARVTKDTSYLDDARASAAFMLAHETKVDGDGRVLFDGTDKTCTGDCEQFKGIGFRYLTALTRADPTEAPILDVLASSARSIWDHARDPATQRFAPDWVGPPQPTISLASDASATMALNLYAELAGAYPEQPAPGTYEAEDAVLHHVGLEASHAGFGGWGYVAGWGKDGQGVDFTVTAKTAGTYVLTLRYSAGAGDASRLMSVDGKQLVANQVFAATSSWQSYASVTRTAILPAGKSTIAIVHKAALGSANYLNLDSLTVHATP